MSARSAFNRSQLKLVGGSHVLFALGRNNGRLLAFPSGVEAAAHCKGTDVRNRAWLFFADDGSPLEARFERLSQAGGAIALSDAYVLQRAMSGLWLQERLDQIRKVEVSGLATLAELVELLKINRSKRIAPGIKRA